MGGHLEFKCYLKVPLLWWDYNPVRKFQWPFKLWIKVSKAITQITFRKVTDFQTLNVVVWWVTRGISEGNRVQIIDPGRSSLVYGSNTRTKSCVKFCCDVNFVLLPFNSANTLLNGAPKKKVKFVIFRTTFLILQ